MRLVITGANGFLGKNLLHHLVGHDIDAVKLLDIHPVSLIQTLPFKCEIFELDLASEKLNELIQKDDVVIHLAWRSNPAVTGSDLEAESKLNRPASENLIRICSKNKAKLVFVSSGGTVYGHPNFVPIHEDHPTNPISAYGKMKLEVENAIKTEHDKSGLQYLIIRPSNLYGPGYNLKKGLGVIGHWVDMIKQNEPVKMVGDGLLIRDFIHMDDLCRGIISSLKINNETFNLGTGIGVSLKGLKAEFEEILNRPVKVIQLEDRKFDVQVNVLSIEKIKKMTGWSPQVSLKAGICQLLD